MYRLAGRRSFFRVSHLTDETGNPPRPSMGLTDLPCTFKNMERLWSLDLSPVAGLFFWL